VATIDLDILEKELNKLADSVRRKRDELPDEEWLEAAKLDREICSLQNAKEIANRIAVK